ncbi:hypothetical protein NN561_004496 [Cricetulus griseus]
MLRVQQLLLLLLFGGSLINAGLDTTSFASLGPWKLKDSPQKAPEKGWCSTWGDGHFSTFDHHQYDFKGMCNYVFTSTCGDALPTFSIQLRRDGDGNISRIIIELGASVVTVNKAIISVRDIGVVSLPYTSNGLQITPYGRSVRLVAKQLEMELVAIWDQDDHLLVLVEKKYMGKLCGLCGNFDGKADNEFLSEDGKLLEPHKYATLQKLDDPSEICAHEAIPSPTILKTRYAQICNQLLTLVSPGCDVPKEPLVLSCQADMADCAQPGQQNCSCATLSEYSRRCSMAGRPVRNWRTPALCPVSQCPANQVYRECGEVCGKTCSNPQHSCSSFCTFGCFCPHGTLMAVYEKSGYSHSETSLVSIIYMSKKDKIVISEDEMVTNNGDTKLLPYKTHNITIFRQTSTHLQMATTFGLELVVQLQPIFQVYITVGPRFKGKTRGLCGNFNGDTTDEFTTSMGIDEGTASLFVDSWRAGNCPAALERETDPCSMSQLNKVCAETHCSMLLRKGSVFEKCHTVVNPQPFYKRCVYQACNYEETFPHICSALGAYAHACSSRGTLLLGWRNSVDNCTVPCTGNRTFSYDSKACDRTCLSLSDRETECHTSAVPVDGCNCPEGTYLNHKAECVHKAQCPCLLDSNKFVQADQSTMINGVICYCINGRLSCPRQAEMFLASCPEPKTFQSCSQSSEDKFGAACAPTCQMLATGIACDDCGSNSSQPTFKVLTENVICGKSGVTCSRAIKITLGGLSITMADRNYTVSGEEALVHLQVKPSPLNLVLDIGIPGRLNLTLVWNKHMSVSIKIRRATQVLTACLPVNHGSTWSQGEGSTMKPVWFPSNFLPQDALCGLCGNSNGNMKDDFETRSKYVASNELEFVNSWKESPLCGDASYVVDPCSLNTFRRPWAERKCNIINSQTFAACHSKVYHLPYYEACVRDTCGCDMGGDCECLCDAVAAYAKACLDKGVCVDWRTPDFCPVYCDFYNIHTLVGENQYQYAQEANCTWHYQPCLCPGSLGSFLDTNIEGCYNCSQNEYFDHKEGTCVPCGSQPTTATPTSTEFSSSSSAATPVGPSYLPGLPTPPASAPSSTEEVTDWTTPKKSTVSSGEFPQTTVATTALTSPLPPTSIPKSTPSMLPVTQATTKPTVSSLSPSTNTTAQFTESTTVTPITSERPGMSTSQESSPPFIPHSSTFSPYLSSTPTTSSTPPISPSSVVSITNIPHSPFVTSPPSFPATSAITSSVLHTSAAFPSSSMTLPLTSTAMSGGSTPQHTPPPSSVSHSPLFTKPTSSHASSVPAFVSGTAASTPVNSSVFPLVTSSIPASALPTTHMTPTPPRRPTTSVSLPSTSKTTSHVPSFSSSSSKSTTSHFTSLTTQASTSGLLSSTMGMTVFPSSPDTNHTTRPPGTSPLPTSVLLSSPAPPTGSSSHSTPVSPSHPGSLISSPPTHPGACSLQEEERQITYQGCVANVTLTHCQGFCASSVSFNTDTLQLETRCGCCQPLSTYEKQFSLPCPDPSTPGQQLTLTLQVFSSCACSPLQCKD